MVLPQRCCRAAVNVRLAAKVLPSSFVLLASAVEIVFKQLALFLQRSGYHRAPQRSGYHRAPFFVDRTEVDHRAAFSGIRERRTIYP